jgi:hypothetical protein
MRSSQSLIGHHTSMCRSPGTKQSNNITKEDLTGNGFAPSADSRVTQESMVSPAQRTGLAGFPAD